MPCFNEEHRIDLEKWLLFVTLTGAKLVLVNDGSTDKTSELLNEISRRKPDRVRVVDLARNLGKAEATRRGLEEALSLFSETTHVGYLDADSPYMASDSIRMLEIALKLDCDVVMGSRVRLLGRDVRRTAHRHFFGRLVAIYLGLGVSNFPYDSQCGLKIFRVSDELREALQRPFVTRWFVDIELILRLKERRTIVVVEEPLNVWVDTNGSKIKFINFGRILLELIKIRRKVRSSWT